MSKHYLFFCSHGYAIPILRPLQEKIVQRGDKVAWYLESSCPSCQLKATDLLLKSTREVRQWQPLAVFCPGIFVYHWFPGVKVEVFHGYPIYKRGGTEETHFRIRGWFDIYLSFGPSSTPIFQKLEQQYGHFKTYETGWAKVDSIVRAKKETAPKSPSKSTPTIFVSTTFTKNVSQLRNLLPAIKQMLKTKNWRWIITKHPKLDDSELEQELNELAAKEERVEYLPITPDASVMAQTDVMLSDASSIILEYMMLDKPVVTFHNTTPGPHLINVDDLEKVEPAIEQALTRPAKLLQEMHEYIGMHESHLDGHNCERILDAVDDFITNYKGRLRRKPYNIFRKLKLRIKLLTHSS